MVKELKLKPGMAVADIGSGNGYHTLMMAEIIGNKGTAYAVDIQPEMLQMLEDRADKAGMKNIKSIENRYWEVGSHHPTLILRGNPGGLLSEAINVTNLFVPKGELIVTTKSKVKKFNQEYRTRNQPEDEEIPLEFEIRFLCDNSTPFGFPVVPDV